MKSETKWTKCKMNASEPERARASERGEGCWLTLGQCRRGAVAFGSWLWRVHNAYCRATYHTNVCADAFTQRPALPPTSISFVSVSLHRCTFVSASKTSRIFLFLVTPPFLISSWLLARPIRYPMWRTILIFSNGTVEITQNEFKR